MMANNEFNLLRFRNKELERDFNEWYLPIELKVFRYALLLGIITYFVYVPLDNILYDYLTVSQFLFLRITISGIVLIMYALSYVLVRTSDDFQSLAITIAIICFGANVSFTFFENVDNFYFYTGNSILIIFIFILLNIRFVYLIFIAMLYVAVHLVVLQVNFNYDAKSFAHQAFGVTSIAIISLASNWIIEFQKRQNFLNKRLIEQQKETLQITLNEKNELVNILKERNQELDAFNHSVSHDLKTPLRNINAFAVLLERRYKHVLDKSGQEYVDFISKGTNKMHTLINDLLAYSKIRQVELEFEEINMDDLAEEIFNEQVQPMESKPILTKTHLPKIKGDKVLLTQVWNNLISNAIKYSMEKGEIKIDIGAKQQAQGVTYFIKDNGIGFDMKLAARLFEPFRRLHKNTGVNGTGVGLSLVHRIIKKHGGKIWAESQINQGSTFYFQLPV